MKKVILLLCCLIQLSAYAQRTKRVLFIGNSYTYVNNLPQLITNMAKTTGDSLVFESHTPGGYTLAQHFASTLTTGKIKTGGWDYVVLQEQSQLPSFEEYNDNAAYNLSVLIKTYNPCANVLFYMTWGRKNGDASNCVAWPPVCTYLGMDSMLRLRYMEMGALNEAGIAPVGAVWRTLRQQQPAIELYDPDESHPSLAGSYAAACSFYSVIFKKDPTQITYNPGLSTPVAASIKLAAKGEVFDSLAKWNFYATLPEANFTWQIGSGSNEVGFVNTSTHADSILWAFGDGTFSNVKYPVHNYPANGTYTATLTASNCDPDTVYYSVKQITLQFCTHTPTVFPTDLVLCPNARDTLRTQHYDTYQWLNALGDTLPNETNQYLALTGGGTYSVLATQNNCSEMSAPVNVLTYSNLSFYSVRAYGNFIASDTACEGDTILLVLAPNKPPYPHDSTIFWFKNDIPLPASNNDSLLITASARYKVLVENPVCPESPVYVNDQLLYTFKPCATWMETNSLPGSIVLFPNPADDLLHVILDGSQAGTSYTIINVLGRVVQTGVLNQENNPLDLSGLSTGMYFLRIDQQSGSVVLKFFRM